MAIQYTDIAAVQAGGVNVLANLNDPNLDNGRVQKITATYTMKGTEGANDIIYIARVPSGALVDPSVSNATGSGIAATATITATAPPFGGCGTDSPPHAPHAPIAATATRSPRDATSRA